MTAKTAAAIISAGWRTISSPVRALKATSWPITESRVSLKVNDALTSSEMFIHPKHLLVSDPFKCGMVHPQKKRSILNNIHINNTENEEETTNEPVVDATNLSGNGTLSMFGLFEQDQGEEEPTLPESSVGYKRIVNGAECLPGDCPWQVATLL